MKTINWLVIFLLLTYCAAAQPCTPDMTYTPANVGVYPESVINGGLGLPSACLNQFYDLTMTAVVPDSIEAIEDSGVFYPIDSIILHSNTNELMNLPPGINLECAPSDCRYIGGGYYCNRISGTATELGTWNIIYDVTVYLDFGGFPLAVPNIDSSYQIIVHMDSTCITSLDDITDAEDFHIYPNPSSDKLYIENQEFNPMEYKVSIYNLNGECRIRQILSENLSTINLDVLSAGIYTILIESSKQSYSKRIIKI